MAENNLKVPTLQVSTALLNKISEQAESTPAAEETVRRLYASPKGRDAEIGPSQNCNNTPRVKRRKLFGSEVRRAQENRTPKSNKAPDHPAGISSEVQLNPKATPLFSSASHADRSELQTGLPAEDLQMIHNIRPVEQRKPREIEDHGFCIEMYLQAMVNVARLSARTLRGKMAKAPFDADASIQADACDLKLGLRESMRHEWSGDTDLGDGNLQQAQEKYKEKQTFAKNTPIQHNQPISINRLFKRLAIDFATIDFHDGVPKRRVLYAIDYFSRTFLLGGLPASHPSKTRLAEVIRISPLQQLRARFFEVICVPESASSQECYRYNREPEVDVWWARLRAEKSNPFDEKPPKKPPKKPRSDVRQTIVHVTKDVQSYYLQKLSLLEPKITITNRVPWTVL
uniref:Uncharacterized protein n=1 Tax=Branchiostoma floridae TaxID=7739 RepID=C3ZUR8_BRAFL|eukprot:XP_002587769.1 hypothetical protein BRAFLDRAFT_94672 [Branchiostoma floridae]